MVDVVHTLKSSGGDYSLISTWESTEQRDLVALDETETLECYKGTTVSGNWQADGSLSENVIISGWNTGVSNFITIKAAAGSEHGGAIGAGFALKKNTTADIMYIDADYTVIAGIEIVSTSTSSSALNGANANADNVTFDSVIAKSGRGTYSGAIQLAGANSYAYNCLVYGYRRGIRFQANNTTAYNCTSVDAFQYGFHYISGNSVTVKNCVAINSGTSDFYGSFSVVGNNASGDSSATGTGSVTGVTTSDFTDYGSGDYRPTSSGKLANAAVDLSTDFLDDITGELR